MRRNRTVSAPPLMAGAAAALLALSTAAWSQQPPTGAQPPAPPGPGGPAVPEAAAVDDQKLEAFANAYVEILEVQEKFQDKAAQADPAQTVEIQQKAQSKAVEALEDHGLSPEEYNQILTQVNADPQLRAQAFEKIEEVRSD